MYLYYTVIENNRQGPFSFEEILRMKLSESDLIWRIGLDNWVPISQLPEYQQYLPPPLPLDLNQVNNNKLGIVPQKEIATEVKDNPVLESDEEIENNGQFIYSGFGLRFIALLIDFIILICINAILLTPFTVSHPIHANDYNASMYGILLSVSWVISSWLYSALFECGKFQATPGKLILGLYVTDWQFKRIGFKKSSSRYLGKFISVLTLGIGFVVINKSAKRYGLYDSIIHTRVIKGSTTNLEGKHFAWSAFIFSVLFIIISLILTAYKDFSQMTNVQVDEQEDKLKSFYDNLIGSGRVTPVQIGDYPTFSTLIRDTNQIQGFYANLTKDNIFTPAEIGDYSTFYKLVVSYNNVPKLQPDDKLRILYDNLIKLGAVTQKEIGDFPTFCKLMDDSINVNKLYNNLISHKIFTEQELGDFNMFYWFIKIKHPIYFNSIKVEQFWQTDSLNGEYSSFLSGETKNQTEQHVIGTDWKTYELPELGSIIIPHNLELRNPDSKFSVIKRDVDYQIKKLKNIDWENSNFIFQPKGLDNMESKAFVDYARVLIDLSLGETDGYLTQNEIIALKKDEMNEIDRLYFEKAKATYAPVGILIISWNKIKVVKINGFHAFKISFIRTGAVSEQTHIIFDSYEFHNGSEKISLTLSYNEDQSPIWKDDFEKVAKSFTISRIKQ